jgi:probable F420-dependent oxidoreductase
MGGELPAEYARTQDPFIALMAAAGVTSQLKLGTGVCLVVERDPIVLAKEVSTLDVLTDGRVLFGVGAGWNEEELAHHGVAFADRFEVLQERVELMQALWTQEEASYDGKHARLAPSWQWPKPRQSPLPVLVGGGGKRAMRLAVALGGGWMPMPSTTKLADRLQTLRSVAADANEPVPPVTMYLVRPDRAVIDHYASLGIDRCVFLLPTQGDAVVAVREIAGKVL